MGLGETQVFQDEKSRLANTTVARIVAAKGSLNDPETKKECCRKLQKLNATLKAETLKCSKAHLAAVMADHAPKDWRPVLPRGFDCRNLMFVSCQADRGPIGNAWLSYAICRLKVIFSE